MTETDRQELAMSIARDYSQVANLPQEPKPVGPDVWGLASIVGCGPYDNEVAVRQLVAEAMDRQPNSIPFAYSVGVVRADRPGGYSTYAIVLPRAVSGEVLRSLTSFANRKLQA